MRLWPALVVAYFVVGALVAREVLPPPALLLAAPLLAAAALLEQYSRDRRPAFLVALVCLLISAGNLRPMTWGDTAPTSQQPWGILRHGTFRLDPLPIVHDWPGHWLITTPDGHYGSAYPPGMALLALPFYLPTVLAPHPPSRVLSAFEKVSAELLSALTVLLLALALLRLGLPSRAVWIASLAYGLCSSAMSLNAHALWQHTGVALGLGVLLYAFSAESRGLVAVAAAVIAAVRMPELLMLAPFALWRPRSIPWMALGGLAGFALYGLHNQLVFGAPWRLGYFAMHRGSGFVTSEIFESPFGLLVSPAHGLLLFSPWVLFALPALRRGPAIARAAVGSALLLYGLMCFWWSWWGGGAFGPRMLSEAQLPLAFALAFVLPAARTLADKALALALAASFVIHASYPYLLARKAGFDTFGAWDERAHPVGFLLEGPLPNVPPRFLPDD